MPTFEFRCQNKSCAHQFEEFKKTVGAPRPPKCPSCGDKTEILIGEPIVRVYGNPTTIGQQAEINSRKLGTEQVQLREDASKKRREEARANRPKGKLPKGAKRLTTTAKRPWWRDTDKPLDISKMTPAKIEKYVQTGKK